MGIDNILGLDHGEAKLGITCVACLFVVIFYTIWTVKVIQHLIGSVRLYRVNKRKDFRDKREQDRILYNYETHIVKDIILFILSCAEASEAFGCLISAIFTAIQQINSHEGNYFLNLNNTCIPNKLIGNTEVVSKLRDVMVYNSFIIQVALISIGSCGYLLLLSFLTDYLSRRYLHHPYKKSIHKHLLLFAAQVTVILILSNTSIHLVNLIIAPILVLIDWCILVRNSRKLRNVLKSNVRDLNLHLRHRYLYRQQLRELQFYTQFMPVLLTAWFFTVLTTVFSFYTLFIQNILVITCEYQRLSPTISKGFLFISEYGRLFLFSIHFILLGLPLCAISIQMLVSACVKRIRSREEHYRFNYSSFPNIPGFK